MTKQTHAQDTGNAADSNMRTVSEHSRFIQYVTYCFKDRHTKTLWTEAWILYHLSYTRSIYNKRESVLLHPKLHYNFKRKGFILLLDSPSHHLRTHTHTHTHINIKSKIPKSDVILFPHYGHSCSDRFLLTHLFCVYWKQSYRRESINIHLSKSSE
jgi:hypothetical protein